MKKIIAASLIIIASLLAGCCGQETNLSADEIVKSAKEEVTKITAEELYNLMDSDEIYTLVDVRTGQEHYHGYIPGSVLMNRGSMEFKILKDSFWENAGLYKPKKEEKVVVYCKKGSRSILAAETLEKMGFENVVYLEGGFKEWELTYPDWVDKNLEALGGGTQTHDMGGGC